MSKKLLVGFASLLAVAVFALVPAAAQAARLPIVVTRPASSVTPTSATLNGTVNPETNEVTSCKFEYGTTPSYGSSAVCVPSPGKGNLAVVVSASVTGLTPNTLYHFTISATTIEGTSVAADRTFLTVTPHYYVNGAKLKEGSASAKTAIAWGTITLTGTKGNVLGGHLTCHTAAAGTLENPTGGGAGEGLIQQYAPFACEQELVCPTGTTRVTLVAENLPWHDQLKEEVAGTIRRETTGLKVDIVCVAGSNIVAELKFEGGTSGKAVEGTGALHPGIFEFDAASGELDLQGPPEITKFKPEGALKVLGYNAQELISVKTP
jgi:hypothetical protein